MKKLNNRGFTLVELLAVIVILIVITATAVPAISSSIERANNKETKLKEKNIDIGIEIYLSDLKFARNTYLSGNCYIDIKKDLLNHQYLLKEDLGDNSNLYLKYQSTKNTFTNSKSGKERCLIVEIANTYLEDNNALNEDNCYISTSVLKDEEYYDSDDFDTGEIKSYICKKSGQIVSQNNFTGTTKSCAS